MAIVIQKNRMGCAVFDQNARLKLLHQDLSEDAFFNSTALALTQFRPSTVITNMTMPADYLTYLQEEALCEVIQRPAADFSHKSAVSKLRGLRSLIRGGSAFTETQYFRHLSVGCAGALLTFLTKSLVPERDVDDDEEGSEMLEMEGTLKAPQVAVVEFMLLDKLVYITQDVLTGLQVFGAPGSTRKEQSALFDVLDHTQTQAGKDLLEHWLRCPSSDPSTVQQRHDTVSFLLDISNTVLVDELGKCLQRHRSMPRVIAQMYHKSTLADWQALIKFAYHAIKVSHIIQTTPSCQGLRIFQELLNTIAVMELKDVGVKVNRIVDFDESVLVGRLAVKPGVDRDLDEMKRIYAGIDDLLANVARELHPQMEPRLAKLMSVVYMPQLGYLIAIACGDNMSLMSSDHEIDGLEFQFMGENMIFYKNERMRGTSIGPSYPSSDTADRDGPAAR